MALLDDAFQVDAILLKLEDDSEILLFGGSQDPHLVEPDAPVGSFYYKADGTVLQKKTPGALFTNWEENEPGAGSGTIGQLPFFNANGTPDNIDLISGNLPFYDADGTYDPIATV